MRQFFRAVTGQPGWWRTLVAINIVGSAFGFWWYRYQLAEVWQTRPWAIWLVPDSPGATFLLTLFLLGLLTQRRWGWLGALACVANMKYGLWTATVLPYQALFIDGFWTFDAVHLSLSHLGMWVQGFLFARAYRPTKAQAWFALGFMYFQDFVDYFWLLIYPTLPSSELFPFARAMALVLSTLSGGFLIWQAKQPRRGEAA